MLATAEWISRFALFEDRGLLSWRVLSLRGHWVYRNRWLQPLYRRRGVAVVLLVRLLAAFAVMLPLQGGLRIGLLAAIVVTGWLFKLRKWLSEDGSDQMGQIVAIGGALTAIGLQGQNLQLCFAGTLVIAGQLTISYFVGGVAKLVSFEWRSGRALVGVMGTQTFGHDLAARVVSASARFSIAFCWLIILAETLFPAAVLGPSSLLVGVLAAFALFHVATALFMGLNTYVFAFVATYPSVLVVNAVILEAMDRL